MIICMVEQRGVRLRIGNLLFQVASLMKREGRLLNYHNDMSSETNSVHFSAKSPT